MPRENLYQPARSRLLSKFSFPRSKDSFLSLLAVLVLASHTTSAWAVLGESEATVPHQAKLYRPSQKVGLAAQKFTVKEIDDSGVMVREYIGPDGKVFAVAWRGIRQPDLSKLLGSYHGELRSAEKQRPPKRSLREPTSFRTMNISAYRGGHMRDIHGVVYLTDHLPEGVRPEDIE